MLIQDRARSRGNRRTLHEVSELTQRSARLTSRLALGLAVSLSAALFACGEDEPGAPIESDNALAPSAPSAGGSAGQGGAGPAAPSAGGGSTAEAGSSGRDGPALPTVIDMGAGGSSSSSNAPAASAGDAGVDGMIAADAGPPDETSPPPFNPCPTDGSACTIMPLGDSITDGLVGNAPGNTGQSVGGYRVELFRQALADGHAITFVGRNQNGPDNVDGQPFPKSHEGYSGATIATGMNQLANRVDAALAANSPDIILLQIGTNNLYQGMAAEVPGQLGSLLDQITTDAPDALVVVAQITPVNPTAFPTNGVDQYNALIPGIVQERVDAGKHLIVVDMNTAFKTANANVGALVGDNIHPNAGAYGIMAETWYAGIEGVLP